MGRDLGFKVKVPALYVPDPLLDLLPLQQFQGRQGRRTGQGIRAL